MKWLFSHGLMMWFIENAMKMDAQKLINDYKLCHTDAELLHCTCDCISWEHIGDKNISISHVLIIKTRYELSNWQ